MDLLIKKYREAEEFSNNKKYLQSAVDYIKENYIRDLGLNEVAEKVQLSPTYFSKIFKEGLNITFIDYINFLRIEKSKELIKSSEITMTEVALKVGYNNDQSFTRYFKKYEGITPGQYRNSIKSV
jgi:YesN/AraC family two-component response regulator